MDPRIAACYDGAVITIPSAMDLRARLAPLAARPGLELLVLFGSHVKGRPGPRSDVDVGVQCESLADLDAWTLLLAPIVGSDRLDLVDLRRADPLLAFEIARTGQVLFERQGGVFHRFQALASLRYADTEKLRVAERRAIHAFLERQGLE